MKALPPARGGAAPPEGEVLFEWRRVGDSLRVVAIDAASGVEVVVFGPVAVGPAALSRLAARKLQRRLGNGRG